MCALQGSQNYNLADEKSDIDVKVFVMPNFVDIYYSTKVSETYETKYGKAEVKDIRLLVDLIKKMNPTYLEILATNYFIADEEFFFTFRKIRNNLPLFVDNKKGLLLKAILGSIRGKMKNLEQSDGSYKTKEFGHILRLYKLFEKIKKEGTSFKEALFNEGEDRDFLLKAKREPLMGTEEAIGVATEICKEIDDFIKENYNQNSLYKWSGGIEHFVELPILNYFCEHFKDYLYDCFGNSF